MATQQTRETKGDDPGVGLSPPSQMSSEELDDLNPVPAPFAVEAVGDPGDLRGLVRNPLGSSLLDSSLQPAVAQGDSHDGSLNINSLDPAALHDLITTIGGVPPLSPASEDCSSEDYSTADSSATADTTATSDLSWQSAQSETTFEAGQAGAGDSTNTQTWNGKNVGARPKDRHLITRQMRKKKREELKQRGDNPDNDDDLVAQLKHLALGEKARDDPPTGTGLYYEEILLQHKNEWDAMFPECPQRLSQAFARCCDLGLVDRCVRIESMYATEELIGCLHSQDYLEKVKSTVNMNLEELRAFSQQYDSVYFNNMTYECGLVSVGGVVEMTRRIVQKKIRNGLALVRPPGHHAEESEACGFSVFNNVAIAAKIAIEELGLNRVLIVDWDVHHGQATQTMFYDDPRVLYFSIHRYEHGKFWPHLRESDYDYIGRGQGEGYNINVPLNKIGMGNSDYMAIFQHILMPIAYEFNPEIVLVSAGYDCALGDVKGEMEVTPGCFPHFLHMVSSLAEGCISVVLEGGYCVRSQAEGVALTLRELLGDPCPLIGPLEDPSQSVTESILNVIKVLRPFWKCLQYQDNVSASEPCPYAEVNQWPPKPGITFSTPENRPEVFVSENYCEENFKKSYESDKLKIKERLDALEKSTSLEKAKDRSCLLFDADMRMHKNAVNTSHPERPDRISRIFDLHVEWGLFHRCHKVQAREATTEELCLIHRQEYVGDIAEMASMSPRELNQLQESYNSVYLCQASNRCARLATGGTLNVVNAVLTGKAQNGVAIVRPPGHHAESHTAMGFCFFNTVAVAAKYAQQHHNLKRVLIVDWDVHHGNGTQHVFDSDPSVLFISIHRFDHGFFYPGSDDANYDVVGFNKGEGFNVNIPFNHNTMGDAEYIAAFQQIIMPIAYEYDPELVLVSAGFDAARGDPLGGYNISPASYGHMTHMLTSLANGRVILVLEGGYNLHSISTSMATCTSVLLGDPCPQLPPLVPCQSSVCSIKQVVQTHQKYWKCLKFSVPLPPAKHCDRNEESSSENEGSFAAKSGDVTDVTIGLEQLSVSNEGLQDQKDDHTYQAEEKAESQSGKGTPQPPQPERGAEGLAAVGGELSSTTGVMHYLQQQGYDEMYAVEPVPWCPHLSTVCAVPERGLDTGDPCAECGNVGENWVCLICYQVLCSRFVNEHMLFHGLSENHLVVLSYADLSVWCYGCDTYVDNPIIYPAKSSAHLSKFGSPLVELSSR